MRELRKLYKEYLKYEEEVFIKESAKWLGNDARISDETRRKFYRNYYRVSFFGFLKKVKDVIHSPSPFDLVSKGEGDDWSLLQSLNFLKGKELIRVRRDGRVIGNKELKDAIPAPQSEEEIIRRIERKLKAKIDPDSSVLDLVGRFADFEPKGDWDQMPISQASAVFTVKKILDYLPLHEKFLFIGDDDFVSVLLSLAEPKTGSLVIDADKDLLLSIGSIASRFKLGIETRSVDLRKRPPIKGNFTGFLCNPPYTEEGATWFVDYGLDRLGPDGGFVFLTVGSENIGNRSLFMQRFFTQRNLIMKEMIAGRIEYPFKMLHPEDEISLEGMKKLFNDDVIAGKPKLGANLWIFNHVPFKVERLPKSGSLYRYM